MEFGQIAEYDGQLTPFGFGARARCTQSVPLPNKKEPILVACHPLASDQLLLQVLQKLVVQIELVFQRRIGEALLALEEFSRCV